MIFDCRGTIHQYISGAGMLLEKTDATDKAPISRDEAVAWAALSSQVAHIVKGTLTPQQGVAFATRNYLFNVNTLSLAEAINYQQIWPATQIDPNLMQPVLSDYTNWIRSAEQNGSCLVIESNKGYGEFNPKPVIALVSLALQNMGFSKFKSLPTPIEGQFINVWKSAKCNFSN